ncbi:MAG: DUF4390 domain-containing protein [Desulfobulbaceae bacterium]|nr:DUF4390 domain-containing protein [Desulfobulbaceae bacterium]
MKTARNKAWCLMLLISLVFARQACAREVMLRDIVVTNSSSDLLLFLKMIDPFSPEVIDGVQNGLTATFTYEIHLHLVREDWPDKEVFSGQLDHTMTYDPLKKEYHLQLSENSVEEVVTDSVDKAKVAMAELNGVKLLPLASLQPDRQYILKVRATLAKKTLPLRLHYLIPFSSFWNVSTDWYTVEFRF